MGRGCGCDELAFCSRSWTCDASLLSSEVPVPLISTSEKYRLQMAVKDTTSLVEERDKKNVRRFVAAIVDEVLDGALRRD